MTVRELLDLKTGDWGISLSSSNEYICSISIINGYTPVVLRPFMDKEVKSICAYTIHDETDKQRPYLHINIQEELNNAR